MHAGHVSKPSADHEAVVQEHYDQIAEEYDRLTAKSRDFHQALIQSVLQIVAAGSRVLEVGSATGDILAALAPSHGLGIELSPAMVAHAERKHPELHFQSRDILDGPIDDVFDYVISVNVMEHVTDLQRANDVMAAMVGPGGTLLHLTPSPAWALPFWVAERFDLKVPEGWHRWRTRHDLINAGERAGLRLRLFDRDYVIPRKVPVLDAVNTAAWARPIRSRLGVIQRVVFDKPA